MKKAYLACHPEDLMLVSKVRNKEETITNKQNQETATVCTASRLDVMSLPVDCVLHMRVTIKHAFCHDSIHIVSVSWYLA